MDNLKQYTDKYKPVLVILLIITLALLLIGNTEYMYAFAEENKKNLYDSTDVYEDLKKMTIDGVPFNVRDYRYYNYDIFAELFQVYKPKIITMQEYCYSNNKSILHNSFGLYIYLYNPYGADINNRINTDSGRNSISLATAYDLKGKPINYETFSLKFCSMSDGEQAGKFYKFRVVDKPISDTYIYDRVNSEERIYTFGDADIHFYNEKIESTIEIGNVYKYTGYAKGCGPDPNSESTLVNSSTNTDTIKLDVSQVVYRTKTSSLGAEHRNQLTSVYFSIPNEYLEKYGNLQGIKAEWFEFETAMGFTTTDDNDYLGMMGQRNKKIDYSGPMEGHKYGFLAEYLYTYNITNMGASGDHYKYYYDFPEPPFLSNVAYSADIKLPELPFVFKIAEKDIDKPVSYKQVLGYMNDYSNSFSGNKLTAKNADGTTRTFKYNANLFSDTMTNIPNNNERKRGYNCLEFYATDELYNMDIATEEDYKATLGFWEQIFSKKPTVEELGEKITGVKPIQRIFVSDVANVDTLQSNLYVGEEYAKEFQSYVKANNNTKATYLLRFALTDYYSSKITYARGFDLAKNASIFKQTAFLDFNIIHLRFLNEQGDTVIPVAMSPMDIIGGYDPPPNMKRELPEWLKNIIEGAIWFFSIVIIVILSIIVFNVLVKVIPLFKSNKTKIVISDNLEVSQKGKRKTKKKGKKK